VLPVRAVLASAVLIIVLGAATSLGPVAVTQARLDASISSAFNDLTVLQQKELGRLVPKGARLKLHTTCARHAGKSEGPGDDWTCTMTVITPLPGFEPFLATPVIYDVSVKSDGCYKAEAPPSFVGQQLMSAPNGHSLVNPLYVIYGCFDTTGTAVKCAAGSICGASTSPVPAAASKPKPPTAARKAERKALQKAEKEAGPAVVQEVSESEQKEKRAAENPRGEAEGEAGK
jgi:hypothetical protein